MSHFLRYTRNQFDPGLSHHFIFVLAIIHVKPCPTFKIIAMHTLTINRVYAHVWQKPYKIFFKTNGLMVMALSIQPYACQYYHDFSNYDPGLTLTLFTQKSTLVT